VPDATHVASGKVRELYALDEGRLLLVASDRISTFDVVLPTQIPDKGRVLTGLSAFWFARTRDIVPNHLLELRPDGRSLECRKLAMLPIECVVRGYLAGSGWRDYRETGAVCGHVLPDGLRESERLPSPIFTPSTKALDGHDENIGEEEAAALCGEELYRAAKAASLALYEFGSRHAEERGILLADTKFELGVDKQFARDWCEESGWDKSPPGPELPDHVVEGTRARYVEAFERLTEVPFDRYVDDPAVVLT
jgi:phosphoribosylaminoimidazole-succinocarboxamide synthase